MDTEEPVQPSRWSTWIICLAWLNAAPYIMCLALASIYSVADAPIRELLEETWANILLLTLAYTPVGISFACCCLIYAIVTFAPRQIGRVVAIAFPSLSILGIVFTILALIYNAAVTTGVP
jgi:hypothetical protein